MGSDILIDGVSEEAEAFYPTPCPETLATSSPSLWAGGGPRPDVVSVQRLPSARIVHGAAVRTAVSHSLHF